MGRRDPAPSWSTHDQAVWHTCDIASAVLAGTADQRPVLASPFPPHLALDERLLAQGDFDLLTFRPVGDGSYVDDRGTFFSTSRGGLALTAGIAATRAAGNRRRRAAAVADSVPRWTLDERGTLWVSTAGFYLQSVSGLFPWPWGSVHSAQLVAPASVNLQGDSQNGPVAWILDSDWAELVFVLWAMAVHPDHPALGHGGWLPPGWRDRASAPVFGTKPPQMPAVSRSGKISDCRCDAPL